jgi:hypothetical protein
MILGFTQVLARVQRDFDFYIRCRMSPAAALQDYTLTANELEAILSPEKMSQVLDDSALDNKPDKLIITFSGKHDWINRTKTRTTRQVMADHDERVATEIRAIRQAGTHEERSAAALRFVVLVD